ncbi:MAG: VWA domain-containing protein, partial [Dermatophilaceae bacterium]
MTPSVAGSAGVAITALGLVLGVLASPTVSTAPAAAPAAAVAPAVRSDDSNAGRLLLMLDASGSMKEPDRSGTTKIEAAKSALTTVVGQLPDDAEVGLRVYGANVDGKGQPTPAACADTQLVAPVAPLDRPALTKAIGGFRAVGETPIAHSLEKGLADLGPAGKRTIVLVSDGQESCVPDPCPVVRKLV